MKTVVDIDRLSLTGNAERALDLVALAAQIKSALSRSTRDPAPRPRPAASSGIADRVAAAVERAIRERR